MKQDDILDFTNVIRYGFLCASGTSSG